MIKGLYLLNAGAFDKIYGQPERDDIARHVDIYAPLQTIESITKNLSLLSHTEVILSGWGCAKMDSEFLTHAPKLKAVFYGAGSVKGIVSDAFWDRDILLTSAYAANALPVAEYALSQILFCLKHGWQYARSIREHGKYPARWPVPGGYESVVGIISVGMIGRRMCELLKPFDLKVLAYDPFMSSEDISKLGAQKSSLEEIFEKSDVVSLHTPLLEETKGMITGDHFSLMKPGATFINTSRGAIIKEEEMIAVLKERPDLFAVLDVTFPEPPVENSPLYSMPNVVVTPHIAGSMDDECRRMGRYMVEELERYLTDVPLRWQITKEKAATLA